MRKLKSFALGFVGVVSALTVTIYAGAAVTGDRLKIPVSIGQAQAVLEKIIFDIGGGSANPTVQSTSTGQVQVTTNGSVAMTVDTNQKVGIGTASPSTTLDVKAASGNVLRLERSNVIYDSQMSGGGTSVNSNDWVFVPQVLGGGYVFATTDLSSVSASTMTIAYTGRVGINQTTPGATLEADLAGSDTTWLRLFRTSGSFQYNFFHDSSTITGDGADLFIGAAQNSSGLGFQTKSAGGTTHTALVMNKDGLVGVNNTNPADTLDVGGGVKATYANLTSTGGNTPHGCTRRTAAISGVTTTFSCNAGEIATGGGCVTNNADLIVGSFPLSSLSGWECVYNASTVGTIYAICCSI